MMLSLRAGLTPIRLFVVIAGLLWVQPNVLMAGDESVRQNSRKLLKQAHEEISVGQPEAALASLQSVLDADPDNPDAHYLMGKVKVSQSALAEAEEILNRGMELAPLSSRIKLLLARIKLAQHAPDEAEGLITEVLALKPHDAEAVFLMGNVALARQDTTGVLDLWHQALAAELGEGAP